MYDKYDKKYYWTHREEISEKAKKRKYKRPILYAVWCTMKARCSNKKSRNYYRYGGRGITVCSEWLQYKNFEKDMLPSFKKGLTIDRIDNDGNYEPKNCRWATYKEQMNNKCNNHLISYKGITKNLKQWAEYLGIKRSTLYMRISQYGWSVERSLS